MKIAIDSAQQHVAELEFCRNRIWVVVVQIDPVSQVILSNAGFNIYIKHISLAVKMQYYISLHSTFRRPKLQEHYEIQNQSKFVMVQLRLEEVIVVMD